MKQLHSRPGWWGAEVMQGQRHPGVQGCWSAVWTGVLVSVGLLQRRACAFCASGSSVVVRVAAACAHAPPLGCRACLRSLQGWQQMLSRLLVTLAISCLGAVRHNSPWLVALF